MGANLTGISPLFLKEVIKLKGRAAILGLLLLAALASLYPLKEKEEKTAPNAPSLQESKDLLFNLQTDKARYNPGDSVQFSIEAEAEGTVKVLSLIHI